MFPVIQEFVAGRDPGSFLRLMRLLDVSLQFWTITLESHPCISSIEVKQEKNSRKGSSEECVFVHTVLHVGCRFHKNSPPGLLFYAQPVFLEIRKIMKVYIHTHIHILKILDEFIDPVGIHIEKIIVAWIRFIYDSIIYVVNYFLCPIMRSISRTTNFSTKYFICLKD